MLISNKGSLIFAFFHCFNVEWSVLNEASSPARHACVLTPLPPPGLAGGYSGGKRAFIGSHTAVELRQQRNAVSY